MPDDEKDLIQTFEDWTEKSPDVMALRWLKNKLSELETRMDVFNNLRENLDIPSIKELEKKLEFTKELHESCGYNDDLIGRIKKLEKHKDGGNVVRDASISQGVPEPSQNTSVSADSTPSKAGSARQTELYCYCCGSPVKEEKNCFCRACFVEVQEHEKDIWVEKADLVKFKVKLEEIKTFIINNAKVQANLKIQILIIEIEKYLEEKK